MRLAVYTLCYNEQFMLPFFVQHYREVAARIIMYDNESTDNSVELAKSLGIDEVRSFSTNNQIRDDITREIRNNCWKELRDQHFDWVAIVDMDEFLYHPHLYNYLLDRREEHKTICIPMGFQMYGKKLPVFGNKPLVKQIVTGRDSLKYAKPILFNPDIIEEMNFKAGAHKAFPEGIIYPAIDSELKLLHYHWLSLDWVKRKHAQNSTRLSDINKEEGWGREYAASSSRLEKEYDRLKRRSFNVFKFVDKHTRGHIGRRMRKVAKATKSS